MHETLPLFAIGACKDKPSDPPPAADNTARNKTQPVTADNAAQSGDGLQAQAKIRKAIMDDSSLSTNAHNCKIVVDKSTVTLAGPVSSADERDRVARIALDSSGLQIVNNLEVVN